MRTATTILAVTVAALVTLGIIMVYSAMMTESELGGQVTKQLVFLAIGLFLCMSVSMCDYRRLKKSIVWVLYGIAILVLLMVFVPGIGVHLHGSNRWIRLAGFSFQSSEFAKGALILALAAYADRYQRKLPTFKYGILFPSLIIGPVIGLIFIEPDMGTTATLGAVVSLMLLVGGVRWAHVIPLALIGLFCVVGYISQNPQRLERIYAYLKPQEYADREAMQALQSQQALTLGGLFGVGLGDSKWKKQIPLQYSDFIFSVIGAELGLVGAMTTLSLFMSLLICGSYIAWHARDVFGMLAATGLTFFICLQAFIHAGVVMGVLPNKGFPLPFISHGGSNLVFNLVAVGLLISIARHGLVRVKAKKKNPFDRHVDVPVAETV